MRCATTWPAHRHRRPRPVSTIGSVLGTAAVPNLPIFFAAWILASLAQSLVLYHPAFTTLTGWYGLNHVRALTTLTLAVGFASTIFAPLTARLLDHQYEHDFNTHRPHRALDQASPLRALSDAVDADIKVIRRNRLGGLIHGYAQVP